MTAPIVEWLPGWAAKRFTQIDLWLPLLLFIILALWTRRAPRWVIFVPAAVGVVCWFFTAPDPRFVSGCLWVLAASVAAITTRRQAMVTAAVLSLIVLFVERGYFVRPPAPIITRPRLTANRGLAVPVDSDQCWNGPLLCTPFPRPDLHLRDPLHPARGFETR